MRHIAQSKRDLKNVALSWFEEPEDVSRYLFVRFESKTNQWVLDVHHAPDEWEA